LKKTPLGSMISKRVMLWISNGKYSRYMGPVIGEVRMYRSVAGEEYKSIEVCGVTGHDLDNEFFIEDVTHWMPLPAAPQS